MRYRLPRYSITHSFRGETRTALRMRGCFEVGECRVFAHSLFYLLPSRGRLLLRVREQNIPLIAEDNVTLVHIYRAKSCYASPRASEAPGATYNGDSGIVSC